VVVVVAYCHRHRTERDDDDEMLSSMIDDVVCYSISSSRKENKYVNTFI